MNRRSLSLLPLLLCAALLLHASCGPPGAFSIYLENLDARVQAIEFNITDLQGNKVCSAPAPAVAAHVILDPELCPMHPGPLQIHAIAADDNCAISQGVSGQLTLTPAPDEVRIALQPFAESPCQVKVVRVGMERQKVRVYSEARGINTQERVIDCSDDNPQGCSLSFSYKAGQDVLLHYDTSGNPNAFFGGWDGPTASCQGQRGTADGTCQVHIPTLLEAETASPITVTAEFSPPGCTDELCSDAPRDDTSVLAGSSNEDVWAGGAGGVSHYDGQVWRSSPTAPANVQSLWARSPRDVWAVTSNSEVYRYDGSSWSRSDEASALGMMFYVGGHPDYNGIWLVGLGKGETQKYLFKFENNAFVKKVPFRDTMFATSNVGIYVGSRGDVWWANTSGEILQYAADADTWSFFPQANRNVSVRGIAGFSHDNRDEVWFVGNELLKDLAVATHYDGISWHRYALDPVNPDSGRSYLRAAWAGDNEVWLIGTRVSFRGVRDRRDAPFTRWDPIVGEVPTALFGKDREHIYGVSSPSLFLNNDLSAPADAPRFKRMISTFPTRPLHGVSGNHRRDVWAVGDAGTILHWDGAAWSEVRYRPVGAQTDKVPDLRSAWGDGQAGVWIAGTMGSLSHCTATPAPLHCLDIPTGTAEDLRTLWGSPQCPPSGCDDRRVFVGGDANTLLTCSRSGCSPTPGLGLGGQNFNINAIWGKHNGDLWLVGALAGKGAIVHGTATAKTADAYLPQLSFQQAPPPPNWLGVPVSIWGDAKSGDLWVGSGQGISMGIQFVANQLWRFVGSKSRWQKELASLASYNALWGSGPTDVWVATDGGAEGAQGNAYLGQLSSVEPRWLSWPGDLHGVWGSGPGEIWAVGQSNGVGETDHHGIIVRRRAP